jgi:hypothetical protein
MDFQMNIELALHMKELKINDIMLFKGIPERLIFFVRSTLENVRNYLWRSPPPS